MRSIAEGLLHNASNIIEEESLEDTEIGTWNR